MVQNTYETKEIEIILEERQRQDLLDKDYKHSSIYAYRAKGEL